MQQITRLPGLCAVLLTTALIGNTSVDAAEKPAVATKPVASSQTEPKKQEAVEKPIEVAVDYAQLRAQYSQPKNHWPAPNISEGVVFNELAPPPVSQVTSIKLAELGEKLFNDPILSASRDVSCASCHEARLAFQDNREKAVGVKSLVGTRNTPPIFGIDAWESFFWDGRTATAEEQALQPIANPIEMNLPVEQAVARLNASSHYRQAFQKAFAVWDITANSNETFVITAAHLGKAIAEFERTINVPETPFIRFLSVDETASVQQRKQALAEMTDQQVHGMHLFRTKARCMNCHNGSLLSDNQFHVTGLVYFGRDQQDLGRYEVTKNPQDSGKFRTPSLWLLNKTFPWMHNGFTDSLNVVTQFYNNGGIPLRSKKYKDNPLFPKRSELLKNLGLTPQERQALAAFLQQL